MDQHHDRNARRARIEHELAANPARSNREIARIVGTDHKTVALAREKMPGGEIGEEIISPDVSPEASGEQVGSSPDESGEILGRAKRFDWCNIPDEAYVIPVQCQTAAYIEEDSGDLIIAQDRMPMWEDEAVIRINVSEVDQFVAGLVAMVKARK